MAHMKNVFLGLTALIATAGAAQAGISGAIIRIEATNADGTGIVELVNNSDFQDGALYSSLDGPVDIVSDSGNVIATVTNLNALLIADPVVNMNFAMFAGNSTTVFKVTSTLLSFDTINNPIGRASSSLSITDSDGNGATAIGLYDGGKVFKANYNGLIPGGTTFASLVNSPIVVGPFDSNNPGDYEESGPGFTPIGEPVSSMSTEFNFSLTARDQFAATSTFVIIPSPGSAVLLGLAGLAGLRRRR